MKPDSPLPRYNVVSMGLAGQIISNVHIYFVHKKGSLMHVIYYTIFLSMAVLDEDHHLIGKWLLFKMTMMVWDLPFGNKASSWQRT
jgi:hypothetical protein